MAEARPAALKALAGFEQVVVDNSGNSKLTPPAGARYAYIQCESADVRWRDDGTNPSAAAGMLLKAGNEITEFNGDLQAFRAIRTAGVNAQLNVSYYK